MSFIIWFASMIITVLWVAAGAMIHFDKVKASKNMVELLYHIFAGFIFLAIGAVNLTIYIKVLNQLH